MSKLMHLEDYLEQDARQWPDKTAVVCDVANSALLTCVNRL